MERIEWETGVFPELFTVGGVQLGPLTLGHAAALKRIGNSWAGPEPGDIQLHAIAEAVWWCCQDWEQAGRRAGFLPARCWIAWKTRVWARYAQRVQVDMIAWQEYNYPGGVRRWARSCGIGGVDAQHALYLHRREQFGEDHREALQVPLRRAWMDLLAQEFGVQVLDPGATEESGG